MFVPVEQVRAGDLVELAGDEYADVDGGYTNAFMEFGVVLHDAYRETPECTTLHIEDIDLFGFPTGHLIRVMGRAEGVEHELDPGDRCLCGYTLPGLAGPPMLS